MRDVRRATAGSVTAPMTAPTPWAATSHATPVRPACKVWMAIAGTSAMKGLAISATVPMRDDRVATALHRPGALRAVLGLEPQTRIDVVGFGRGAERTKENMTTTKTKEAALIAKQTPGEAKASVTPASSGPMMRPRLNCAEDSDTAAKTSSRSTRSGNNDCHAAHDAELTEALDDGEVARQLRRQVMGQCGRRERARGQGHDEVVRLDPALSHDAVGDDAAERRADQCRRPRHTVKSPSHSASCVVSVR